MNRLGDTSAFVNPAGQLLLTRRGNNRIDSVGIVFVESPIHSHIDSSRCLAHLTPSRVGIARSAHVQLGGINTCHKMIHCLSLPTVTYICMGELPHFHHGPTSSFLHSQPIQTPPSGPGLICAAGQVFICAMTWWACQQP